MITHLQYLVLTCLLRLRREETSGKALRKCLNYEHSLPAFYQLMRRIEDDGLVTGRYKVSTAHHTIRSRCYQITRKGRAAYRRTQAFYR